MSEFNHRLMEDPIQKDDILALKAFLNEDNIPFISNGKQVEQAEKDFAAWLGVRFCVAVSSGSSGNFITMAALKLKFGKCSVCVPPLTWCSDWYSVIQAGLEPITCDINKTNLSFDIDKLRKVIRPNTRAIFLTHVLGLNGISESLLELCREKNLLLIEDACETVGATYKDKKIGTFGFAANWSSFCAHHFSSGEGGLVTTDNEDFYETLRYLRAHGLNRDIKSKAIRDANIAKYPELNKDFIFLSIAGNCRPTEITGVLLQSQLKKLDSNNQKRIDKFKYFMERLDPNKYYTGFNIEGQCAYSFIVILKEFNKAKWKKVEEALDSNLIQYRRGLSGGGSQLRQPYLQQYLNENNITIDNSDFPVMEHIHYCSCYVGLYPGLEQEKIDKLLQILNSLDV